MYVCTQAREVHDHDKSYKPEQLDFFFFGKGHKCQTLVRKHAPVDKIGNILDFGLGLDATHCEGYSTSKVIIASLNNSSTCPMLILSIIDRSMVSASEQLLHRSMTC